MVGSDCGDMLSLGFAGVPEGYTQQQRHQKGAIDMTSFFFFRMFIL